MKNKRQERRKKNREALLGAEKSKLERQVKALQTFYKVDNAESLIKFAEGFINTADKPAKMSGYKKALRVISQVRALYCKHVCKKVPVLVDKTTEVYDPKTKGVKKVSVKKRKIIHLKDFEGFDKALKAFRSSYAPDTDFGFSLKAT